MLRIPEKLCLECGTTLRGRADKKFCSDQCRSTFNNRIYSDETNYIRKINAILRKNWRILKELNPDGKIKVIGQALKTRGFDFQYFTSVYTTKEGAQYFYCYEQGYLLLEKDYYLLVTKKEK
jgi:predicted nucleic acid-binding Zn ribbon protein